jgi:hypothetical protein
MAKAALSVWPHFARWSLADLHVEQVRLGIRTFTLFAPRGFGKTEFIKLDLIPAAVKAGLRCVYIDLGLVPGDRAESLIQQLAPESVTAGPTATRFPRLKRAVKRLSLARRGDAKFKASVLGQSVEIDLRKPTPAAANRQESDLALSGRGRPADPHGLRRGADVGLPQARGHRQDAAVGLPGARRPRCPSLHRFLAQRAGPTLSPQQGRETVNCRCRRFGINTEGLPTASRLVRQPCSARSPF